MVISYPLILLSHKAMDLFPTISDICTSKRLVCTFYFINAVKCLKCWNTSDTYDPLLDISVETKNCPTLGKALKKITKPDMLDGDNKYSCPK